MFRTIGCMLLAALAFMALAPSADAQAQGPLTAHPGLRITTAFSNSFGPDAESIIRFGDVTPSGIAMDYISSRGLAASRVVTTADHLTGHILVLGFSPKMPHVIANSTSLGISTAALDELRTTGHTSLALMYDTKMSTMNGTLTLVQRDFQLPVLIEGQIVNMAAVRATGTFSKGKNKAQGDFYILDDRNNPVVLQYTIHFNWEKQPRTERIVLVEAGNSQQAAMQQTLKTIRKLDVYGIRFDFDKATIRPETTSIIADIAKTLKVNPAWTILIKGHTDSIGDKAYNLKLSEQRAAAVKAYLVSKFGIDPNRLTTSGVGMSEPKASETTLQGRKINRRVELVRTDR